MIRPSVRLPCFILISEHHRRAFALYRRFWLSGQPAMPGSMGCRDFRPSRRHGSGDVQTVIGQLVLRHAVMSTSLRHISRKYWSPPAVLPRSCARVRQRLRLRHGAFGFAVEPSRSDSAIFTCVFLLLFSGAISMPNWVPSRPVVRALDHLVTENSEAYGPQHHR